MREDLSKWRNFVSSTLKKDPNKFWRYTRSIKDSNPVAIALQHNNNLVSDPLQVSNIFADHFKSVFISSSPINSPIPFHPPCVVVPKCSFTPIQVFQELAMIKKTFNCGPDDIPNAFVAEFADILAPVLCHIFNFCLQSTVFPRDWNRAYLIPIFKSGNSKVPNNYRPISICCAFNKVFEGLILKHIDLYFSPSSISRQHGFTKGKSTLTNLMSSVNSIATSISKRKQVDVVYFDLKKAFDLVDHNVLVSKLYTLGFDPALVQFLASYLSCRSCSVKVSNTFSNWFPATSGIHQGSRLGPRLFSLIMDVGDKLDCAYELFADDLKIYREIESINSCHLLQSDINTVYSWACENKLVINTSKTSVISFTRSLQISEYCYFLNGAALSRVVSIRDLGVILDPKLSFDIHLNNIINCALRSLGLITHISRGLSAECFTTLYKSIVRPILEYVVPIWSGLGVTKSELVESVQGKFIRTCYLRFYRYKLYYSYERMCSKLGLELLSQRRTAYENLFVSKCLSRELKCHVFDKQVIVLPQGRRAGRYLYIRELSHLCALVRCVCSFNSLPINSISLSLPSSLKSVLHLMSC